VHVTVTFTIEHEQKTVQYLSNFSVESRIRFWPWWSLHSPSALVCYVVLAFTTNAAPAVAAHDDDDTDDDNSSALSSPSDVMDVADADRQQQAANERLATSASALISNYILAKLLGTSPAGLATGVLLPTDGRIDGLLQLPSVPFPVVPRADGEVGSRMMSPELDPAASVPTTSTVSTDSDVPDAESSALDDSVDAEDTAAVRRMPVESPFSLSHRHHKLDVNKVDEMLMEWNGDRGKARSVSNAAANLVVFAPLSPGRALRRPEIVLPTATSMTFRRSPPSTAPNSLSSLRAIVEKSLGEESDAGRPDYAAMMAGDTANNDDSHVSGNASTAELDAFKSGPAAENTVDEQIEDIGVIAQDQDYVTSVTGFHLRPRLFPGAAQKRSHLQEPDRTASVPLMLPPDNTPWTISEDTKLTEPEKQLPVGNNVQDEDDVIKPTLGGRESQRDSQTNAATTNPSVFMYTVLSAATRRSEDQEHDDVNDVRDDVKHNVEDDVGYDVRDDDVDDVRDDVKDNVEDDVGYDVGVGDEDRHDGDDDGEDVVGSLSVEGSQDDEKSQAAEDLRRLSPEFLRVMRSLWPGLKICSGLQCNSVDTTGVLASSSDVDDEATVLPSTGLPRDYEDDFFAVHTASTKSVATPPLSTDDVTVTSRPATTPSLWQVRGSTSFQTGTTTTSLRQPQRQAGNVADDQLTSTRRRNVRLDESAIAGSDKTVTSDRDIPEGLITRVTLLPPTTTESGVQLVDDMHHDRLLLGRPRHRGSLSDTTSTSVPRPVYTRGSRPEFRVPRTRRPEAPIHSRGRPFHVHQLRIDPTRGETSHGDTQQRPFRRQHDILPPDFSFLRNPTIVRHRPDVRGLPDRRRVRIVDEDSGLVRSSEVASRTDERLRHQLPGSLFNAVLLRRHGEPTHPALSRDRSVVFSPQSIIHEKSLEKTTASNLTGKSGTSVPATIANGENREEAGSEKIKDTLVNRTAQSASTEDEQGQMRQGQTTHRSSSHILLSSSKKDRGQNVREEGSKTPEFAGNTSKASLSLSDAGVVTRLSAPSEVDFESRTIPVSTADTSSQPLRSTSTESQRTTSDKIEVAPTSNSNLPTVTDRPETDSFRTTAARPGAASPSGGEPLPVQARPGAHDHSAAAIAMLGGYADWMVGLISAVAVSVFIFLAILSFLAVMSCRCVSSR